MGDGQHDEWPSPPHPSRGELVDGVAEAAQAVFVRQATQFVEGHAQGFVQAAGCVQELVVVRLY